MKKIFLKINFVFILLAIPSLIFAAGENGSPDFYSRLSTNLIFIIGAIVIFGAIAMLVHILNQIIKLREIQIYQENGWEEYLETKNANQESWWQRMNKLMTAAVPLEKEKDILLNHNYDGIQELDNNLPPWWLYGFYLTIGISIFYVGYYHFSSNAKSSTELYAIEMEQAEAAKERFLEKQANRVDETNVYALTDPVALSDGKNTFNTYCVACHTETGGGAPNSVGPNLTDEYWIHGGGIKNIFKTIKYGVPEKGMISWKDQLRPTEMHAVASYILSLQGTNPPNAKGPQGERYVSEEATSTSSDSTEVQANN